MKRVMLGLGLLTTGCEATISDLDDYSYGGGGAASIAGGMGGMGDAGMGGMGGVDCTDVAVNAFGEPETELSDDFGNVITTKGRWDAADDDASASLSLCDGQLRIKPGMTDYWHDDQSSPWIFQRTVDGFAMAARVNVLEDDGSPPDLRDNGVGILVKEDASANFSIFYLARDGQLAPDGQPQRAVQVYDNQDSMVDNPVDTLEGWIAVCGIQQSDGFHVGMVHQLAGEMTVSQAQLGGGGEGGEIYDNTTLVPNFTVGVTGIAYSYEAEKVTAWVDEVIFEQPPATGADALWCVSWLAGIIEARR